MEIAGKKAREYGVQLGYRDKDIGVFFITPCPAKVTSILRPVGVKKSYINGAFSITQIYSEIIKKLSSINEADLENLQKSSGQGIIWGVSGGEKHAVDYGNRLSVDGIHNVINVLEEVEMGKLNNMDYIECQACIGGCIGGALTVENRFIARIKLERIARRYGQKFSVDCDEVLADYKKGEYFLKEEIKPKPIQPLDKNLGRAVEKMKHMEKILEDLPGLDCGACGAPNCQALAEDIVRGYAQELDCIIILKERVNELAEKMVALSKTVPPAMGIKEPEEEGTNNWD